MRKFKLVSYALAHETCVVSFRAGPHSNASFAARAFASSAFAASITKHTPCRLVLRRMKNLDFELFDFGILAGSFTGDLCSSRHAPQSETDAAGYIRSYAANLTKLKVPHVTPPT